MNKRRTNMTQTEIKTEVKAFCGCVYLCTHSERVTVATFNGITDGEQKATRTAQQEYNKQKADGVVKDFYTLAQNYNGETVTIARPRIFDELFGVRKF